MKTIFKMIIGLLVGVALGLVLGGAITVLFTDNTFSEYIEKFKGIAGWEAATAAAVGMCAFVVSLLIIIPAHEAGHLVCGLLTGYKFVSFRIFNFTFIKIDGKIRIKKYSIAGTGGQCLLTPPDLPLEKVPIAWYNAGGVLANILLLIIVVPFIFLDINPFVKEAMFIFCFVDVFLILMNGIPMKLGGVSNDGYNILHLRNHTESKRSLMIQLRSNTMIQEGVRPKDMPDEWFEWNPEINYKNPLEVARPMMHASRLIDEMEWESAYQEFEELYGHKNDIMSLYITEIACELIFCALVTGRKDRAEEILDEKLKKYITGFSKVMSSKMRILCAVALYIENDREKAEAIYKSLKAAESDYLLQGEVKSDLAIMQKFLTLK